MTDTAVLWVRAEAAMNDRRYVDAEVHLRQLIEAVDRIDFEYEEWLRALAECLRELDRDREVLACAAYLGLKPDAEFVRELVTRAERGDERARMGVQMLGIYFSRAGEHSSAARMFELSEMPAHRAIALERAGEDKQAADIWMQMIASDVVGDRPYERALVRVNYGLCLRRLGHERARSAIAEATTAVEEVADAFETEGLRERSFDCYQLIARLGSEADAFENVAEGYLNSVRILRDDGLKLDALRLYETFVALAHKAREFHAVATILREAAEYCTRSGLPYAADLRMRSADAWLRAAGEAQAAGHPIQMIENALQAAGEAFASVRAYNHVADVYRRMLGLELSSKSRERAIRMLRRLGSAPPEAPRPIPVPEFLKQLPDYEEVWYVDIAEWELGGDPALIAAGVMADRRFPDYVRRNALLLVVELERDGRRVSDTEIVERLEKIRAYPVIAALEALYARDSARLRVLVAKAMGSLRFKRSFTLLFDALRDDRAAVREAAASSVTNLLFPHAFEPLRRIFEARDLPNPEQARVAALRAIGKIGSVEALDFLCDRLREGEKPFAMHAHNAISQLTNPELLPYLRRQIEFVPAEYRVALEDIARHLEQRHR
jgi:tetratricopeptide (TPR) repeat protein